MSLFIFIENTKGVLHLDNSNKTGIFKDTAILLSKNNPRMLVEKMIMNMILKGGETNLKI